MCVWYGCVWLKCNSCCRWLRLAEKKPKRRCMLHTGSSSSLSSLSIPLVRLCLGSSPAGILRTLTNAKNDIVVILILLCSALLSSAHPYPSRHHHHHYSLRLSKLRHHLQAIASRNLSKSSSLPHLSLSLSHLTPSECATVCVRVCLKSLLRRSFYTHLAAAADEQLRHQAPNLSINNLQTRFQCGSLK